MGLDAAWYNDLLLVWVFLLRMGPGDCFQVNVTVRKALREGWKSSWKETNLSSCLSLPIYNLCCFAYKWFPQLFVFQNMGICPSVDL